MRDLNRDWWTLQAMEHEGGGFVKKLAACFYAADLTNQNRLRQAFPDLWAQYELRGDALRAAADAARLVKAGAQ